MALRLRWLLTVTILLIVTVLLLKTLPAASASVAQTSDASQIDRGRAVYDHYCITCHGDHGQGLTAEWRATFPPQDQNCWKSKCHAVNHPPEGFILPRVVPALAGPDALTKFNTAQQLYSFIEAAMPFYSPGLLTSDQYWDIAAYLLTLNQVQFDGTLSSDDAPAVYLRPQTVEEAQPAAEPIIVAASVAVAGLVAAIVLIRRRATRSA
jgi:cytochrome c